MHWTNSPLTGAGIFSVQFYSVAQLCLILCNPMDCSIPGFPVHYQFLELAQTHVSQVGDAIQSSPLLLLPSIFSSIRGFSIESVLCIRWPKYCSFSFSINPSNDYSGLIALDWLDLFAIQGPLKSLLQHHSSKASIVWCSDKIMASSPITSWEIDGETVETVSDFIFWAPKSPQMVIVAMKLKDAYSLEGKL